MIHSELIAAEIDYVCDGIAEFYSETVLLDSLAPKRPLHFQYHLGSEPRRLVDGLPFIGNHDPHNRSCGAVVH
jgi:hypothetical protein